MGTAHTRNEPCSGSPCDTCCGTGWPVCGCGMATVFTLQFRYTTLGNSCSITCNYTAIELQCTRSSAAVPVHALHCTQSSARSLVHAIQCTRYNARELSGKMHALKSTRYNARAPVYDLQSTRYNARAPVYNLQCTRYNVSQLQCNYVISL